MKVFEYVIAYIPKKKKGMDESQVSKILADEKVIALDVNKAGIIAARKIPEEYLDRLEEIEVIVRPFN